MITKASLIYGIGDALNARAFLSAYCKQKNIERSSIRIYSPKHWWMFEGMGFTKDDNAKNFSKLVSYRNFGNYNLPKKYNVDKLDLCIAKNAGIKFSFNDIELLPKYEEPNIDLPERFITFNTGYGIFSGKPLDEGYICIKAWSKEYWQKLVDLINIPMIQIGAGKSCEKINCYLNLVDKLTLQESAEVLRKSLFHIDIEGGLVILNQHLGKKSVVLFGPTAIENQGRSFNLNIRKSSCSPCYEWGIHIKSLSLKKEELNCNAHCMKELKPEYVVEQIYKNNWL